MSGGPGGPRPDEGPNCADIQERTPLNSVNPSTLAGLQKGDVLQVQAEGPTGPLRAINDAGEAVGSITSAALARLLSCIQQGFEYVAIVQSIKGGQVIVIVRPK